MTDIPCMYFLYLFGNSNPHFLPFNSLQIATFVQGQLNNLVLRKTLAISASMHTRQCEQIHIFQQAHLLIQVLEIQIHSSLVGPCLARVCEELG